MRIVALLGLALSAGALVTAQHMAAGSPDQMLQQIRLDRPVGGDGGGSGGGSSPAPASGNLIKDVNADELLRLMQGLKYSSVTVQQGKTSRFIKAVIDDQPTFVFLNNCKDNRCSALQFAAFLGKQDSVTDAFMHDYNRNTIFTKMAKDTDGDLEVTMGVGLAGGVSPEHVRWMADGWTYFFKDALNYKPKGK